ncbi:hypothetical protein E6O75_ATG10560 [Venturia nashicola]|uniref:Uncharacterized protein n=1 Tax=Venturia nashicola TaxID=86259 RepID=A0A4Z1P996_9PEZI|nr:hypothetical protein E6O75_ATG10560 [Venturia nashicola]
MQFLPLTFTVLLNLSSLALSNPHPQTPPAQQPQVLCSDAPAQCAFGAKDSTWFGVSTLQNPNPNPNTTDTFTEIPS